MKFRKIPQIYLGIQSFLWRCWVLSFWVYAFPVAFFGLELSKWRSLVHTLTLVTPNYRFIREKHTATAPRSFSTLLCEAGFGLPLSTAKRLSQWVQLCGLSVVWALGYLKNQGKSKKASLWSFIILRTYYTYDYIKFIVHTNNFYVKIVLSGVCNYNYAYERQGTYYLSR